MTPEERRALRKASIKERRGTASGNYLDKTTKKAYISKGEEKLGAGFNNIVLSQDRVSTNVTGAGNPGFTFAGEGSELRAANDLTTDIDSEKVNFGGGMYTLNPLMRFIPSNTVTYYPLTIPVLPIKAIKALAGVVSQIQSILGSI